MGSVNSDGDQTEEMERQVRLVGLSEQQKDDVFLKDCRKGLDGYDPQMELKDDEDDPERQVEFGTLAEQKDETYYDHREDAEDDLEKSRIKFPKDLYGRDKELQEIHAVYAKVNSDAGTSQVIFLAGYSGTGKSALVDEFMKRLTLQRDKDEEYRLRHVSGKFNDLKAAEPFAAIAHALNCHVSYLVQSCEKNDLRPLKKRLNKARIYRGSENAEVLKHTLVHNVDEILPKPSHSDKNGEPVPLASSGFDLNVIKFVFQKFVHALAAEGEPLIMFMDDLQWADQASFELLSALLKDKSSKHVLFIGAYRPNEIDDGHQLNKLMKEIEETKGTDLVKHIEIFNLSPDSIVAYIADAIERNKEEVTPIAEAVYSKTLGNIFFVKQALEELVRRNALYFDVICYEWQFRDIARVDIDKFLSDDVMEMVLSKLQTLPEALQHVLRLAGYIRNTIEIDLLQALVSAKLVVVEPDSSLPKLMELAYDEGLVLRGDESLPNGISNRACYKFAHDRIREAACTSLPAGDERDQLLLCISKVLLDRGSIAKDSWMLFTAAQHLNSLPSSKVPDILQLIELNFTVGKIAVSKGAFNEGAIFFRAAAERLNPETCWQEQYTLCLDLKNSLMEAELFLGNVDCVFDISSEIFENAKILTDKSRAHYCYMDAGNKKSNDHDQSVDMALGILDLYNIKLPKHPSSISVKRENLRLNLALGRRTLLCLADFPISTDPLLLAQMKIATMALTFSVTSKRGALSDVLGRRMIRLVLANKAITKDVPFILGSMGGGLRQRESYREAVAFGNAAINMMSRFPHESSTEFLKAKMTVYSVCCLRMPYKDAIETNMELHRLLYAKGQSLYSMATAMMAMLAYMNASLRINTLYESKLGVLEELANNSGQKTFAVVFATLRQTAYNLNGGENASSNPVEFKGTALDEESVQSQFEGGAKKMNARDIGMFRLMLAVIFNDEMAMDEMLNRLDEYPIFDIIIERQHVRMTYVGFATLILGQKTTLHKKWAKESLHFFSKLDHFGSSNGQPVYACLRALDKESVAAFDDAIQICANQGLTHLVALMNERCGMMLLKKPQGGNGGEDYLKCATWLWNDWGATGKVQQLLSRYKFLRSAGEKMPSQLSGMMKHVGALTMPSNTELFSEMRSVCSS